MATIAIINTSEETVDMLSEVLDDEGFTTVTMYVIDLKRGEPSPKHFFEQHRPDAVVYDIALPYEENWDFCLDQVLPASGLTPRHFVFTSTNTKVLERLVGPTGAIEIMGKPYDLHEIVRATWLAVHGNQPNPI